jgi:hypothetical protein
MRKDGGISLAGLGLIALVVSGCTARKAVPAAEDYSSSRFCDVFQPGGPCVYDVSLIELIANPTQWNGKRVQVVGFMHLEFEGTAIYVSEEDGKQFITKNGLWLSFRQGAYEQAAALNDRYVRIRGTFLGRDHGHLGLWSGSLDDVDGTFLP